MEAGNSIRLVTYIIQTLVLILVMGSLGAAIQALFYWVVSLKERRYTWEQEEDGEQEEEVKYYEQDGVKTWKRIAL